MEPGCKGNRRGYVKNGRVLQPDSSLKAANLRNLQKQPVHLTTRQREIINQAITDKAKQLGQKVPAAAICQNHVHLVIAYNGTPIEYSVKHYKNVAIVAMRKDGLDGRLWSGGFDKLFCFDRNSLQKRIDYVNSHNRNV